MSAARAGRIVVGIDGSDGSRAALRWAVVEARVRHAAVEVVHAWDIPVAAALLGASGRSLGGASDVTRRDAERVLAGAVLEGMPIGGEDVVVLPRLAQGSPPGALLRSAGPGDLLVLGRRGLDGFAGLLLGTVAEQCLHHARGPVAIVPAKARTSGRAGRVVVGVDGSPASRAALAWAVEEAVLRGMGVLAVHVWHQPVVHHAGVRSYTFPVPDLHLDAQSTLERTLDDVAGADREAPVEGRLAYGKTASSLLTALEPGDLLVLGSRGRGGFAGLLLGSVSRECAERATSPVVVVPAPASGPAGLE